MAYLGERAPPNSASPSRNRHDDEFEHTMKVGIVGAGNISATYVATLQKIFGFEG